MSVKVKDLEVCEVCKTPLSMPVPSIADLIHIADTMVPMNKDKHEIALNDEDRIELAAILYTKAGVSHIMKKAKEMEEKVKKVGVSWMLARQVKMVKAESMGTLTQVSGGSATISQDNLRKAMVAHIGKKITADLINQIVNTATSKSSYETLQFKEDKSRE